MNDYRCINGHPSSAPDAEHGGPWSTLVCPVEGCGATTMLAGFDFPMSAERGCDASGQEDARDGLGSPAQHDALVKMRCACGNEWTALGYTDSWAEGARVWARDGHGVCAKCCATAHAIGLADR